MATLVARVTALEERLNTMEGRLVSRQALDEELRALELRLREIREREEG